jgi:2-phospho-L-lactate transferase/gluconeogenesis factor (CofD/UPF0052 family)
MLTIRKLYAVLGEVISRYPDDIEVVIEVSEGQAESINSVGVAQVGVKNWNDLVVVGVPNVTAKPALMLSTEAP